MKPTKIKINPEFIRASFVPESFDAEKRTVEIVWTTGAKVKRWSWTEGEYFEELSLKKADVNLERLNAGAPLLNNHSSWSLNDSIGVVEKAWIKNKEGRALVRFSERDEVAGIVKDVETGVIRNISVGYSVQKYEDVTKKEEDIKTFRAVEWTPMELSFVNIPADIGAQVRSAQSQPYEVEIFRQEESMENDDNNETQEPTSETRSTKEPVAEPTVDLEKEKKVAEKRGQDAEMKRQSDIRALCKSVKMDDEIAEKLISEKKSVADANSEIVRLLAEKNSETETNGNHDVEVGVENQNKRKDACANAVEHLYGHEKRPSLIDGAREFCGYNILDVARRFMESEGLDVRNMSPQDIAKIAIGARPDSLREHVSSDFPFIVADLTNKTLQRDYGEVAQSFEVFTTERPPVVDFKTIQSTKFGDAPELLGVNEKGEYQEGTISEGKETYKIGKYGRLISVTEELLMNDDLGAMLKLASKFGRRARYLESNIVWGTITANAAMGDGTDLFHADHGNLAAAGAIFDVTTVGAGRLAMRQQKGLDGLPIEIRPVYLVVPAALETAAEKFLRTTITTKDDDNNPFKSLKLISDTRLDDNSATAWYLFSDKGQSEMVETVKMRGFETPQISTKLAFETDAMKMKVKYYYAAKVLDWVGLYRNPGV